MTGGAVSDDGVPVVDVLALFAGSEAGEERAAEVTEVFAAYGQTMVYGQLLEWAAGLAAPAATAPAGDDVAASAAVARGLGLTFFNAIRELAVVAAAGGGIELPADLIDRLDSARSVRNGLAHDWVWDGGMRSFTGRSDEVLAELNETAETFAALVGELFTAVFAGAITARGISLDDFETTRHVLAAALLTRPDLAGGVVFPDGADVLAQRIVDEFGDRPAP